MGLKPLEFSDCLTDSPYFRENLHEYEKELDRTSKAIKGLMNELKDLLNAARTLSKAQRSFSATLENFQFDCVGSDETDDEKTIGKALHEFAKLINSIEDARDRMLDQASQTILVPLEQFRKEQIGAAKECKRKFEKQTTKFCGSLDRYLNLKTKSGENALQEADVNLEFERKHFYEASMRYVLQLQGVQERKKFEFVEALLSFIYMFLTFYHQGYDIGQDNRPYTQDLQMKLQKCRENYQTTHEEAEGLLKRMLEVRGTYFIEFCEQDPVISIESYEPNIFTSAYKKVKKPKDQPALNKANTREGYLYMLEKKALVTSWTKYYCTYQKDNKIFTMIPYNQVTGKGITTETMVLESCTRRASDSIEKRFCFDVAVQDKRSLTLQALSEDDRRLWLDAMDGKEPIYSEPTNTSDSQKLLDDIGTDFIKKCIQAIETRGLDDEGLYRVSGVNSRINKLTNLGLDRRKSNKVILDDSEEWDIKTITSALKHYFRSLPEPIMTFDLHYNFISAAKQTTRTLRIQEIHELVHKLPEPNFEMLEILCKHLNKVAKNSDKNLMTIANIGVCFGPTLMRPKEETMAAIMDIKWCNIVVEVLIEHYDKIFHTQPDGADITNTKVFNSKPVSPRPMSQPPPPPSKTQGPQKPTKKPEIPPQPQFHSGRYSMHNRDNNGIGSPHTRSETSSSLSSSATNSSLNSSSHYANIPEGQQTYAQYRAKLKPVGIYGTEHNSSNSSSTESLNSRSSIGTTQSSPAVNTTTPVDGRVDATRSETRRSSGPVYSNQPQDSTPVEVIVYDRSPTPPRRGNGSRLQPPSNEVTYANLKNSPILVHRGASPFQPEDLDLKIKRSPKLSRSPMVSRKAPNSKLSQSSSVLQSRPDFGSWGYAFRKRKSVDSLTLSMSSSTSSVSSVSSGSQPSRRKVRTLYSCDAENESELSFEPNQIITNVKQSREPGWLEGSLDGKTGLIPANYVEYLN